MCPKAFFCITGRTCHVHLLGLRGEFIFVLRSSTGHVWDEPGIDRRLLRLPRSELHHRWLRGLLIKIFFLWIWAKSGWYISHLICKLRRVTFLRQYAVLAAFLIWKAHPDVVEPSCEDAHRHSSLLLEFYFITRVLIQGRKCIRGVKWLAQGH